MGEVWRLFASVLIMSDTGSIAMTNDHSDWPTWDACKTAERVVYAPKTNQIEMLGHRVQIKVSTECVGVKFPGGGPPPPPEFYRGR